MRAVHFVVAVAVCHAGAALGAADAFTVPLMRSAPRIDGRVDEREWALAAGFDGFQFEGMLVQRRIRAYVGATEDALHVAILSQLPDEGELAARVDNDSLKAVFDDSLELYIDPSPDAQQHVVYRLLVNSRGKGGYKVHIFGGAEEDASWNGNWKQAHAVSDGWWRFECSIPVSSMNMARGRTATEGRWGVNLTRNWKSPWEWSSLSGKYVDALSVFRFVSDAYYPFKNRMRIVADVGGLSKDARLSRAVAEVRKAGTTIPVKTVEFPAGEFTDGRKEKAFDLPPLDGAYEIALKVEGTNVPAGEVVKEFERTRWEWEGTSLGTSTDVYAPFTPIQTSRNTLKTVLRDHELNGLGLWDQVTCESAQTGVAKPVLAAPMRYTAAVDGVAADLKPTRMRFGSRAPHEVKVRGGFGSRESSAIANTT